MVHSEAFFVSAFAAYGGLFYLRHRYGLLYAGKSRLFSLDILNNGFSHIFGCSFGTSSITIAFILILVLLLFKQKIGIGTIGNMIFLGLFCDFLLESGWIPLMHTWYMGILFIIIGARFLPLLLICM